MSAEDYHDNVYSSYRPTSATLRSDAGNVPPGRFREEVTRGSTEDAYAETDPITAYPIGTTTATVSAGADWNSLGHSGTVETQRSDGGGSQLLTDDEDGSQYRRYWADDDWSEWEAAGGGGVPSNIQPLDADSRDFNAEPSEYPVGVSLMPVLDDSEEGTWGWEFDAGRVWTIRDGTSAYTIQIFIANGGSLATRAFGGVSWSAFKYLKFRANITVDGIAESDSLFSYPEGSSTLPVTAGANWGPNTGEAGVVLTVVSYSPLTDPDLLGGQTFYSEAGVYSRYWDGSAWSTWT